MKIKTGRESTNLVRVPGGKPVQQKVSFGDTAPMYRRNPSDYAKEVEAREQRNQKTGTVSLRKDKRLFSE